MYLGREDFTGTGSSGQKESKEEVLGTIKDCLEDNVSKSAPLDSSASPRVGVRSAAGRVLQDYQWPTAVPCRASCCLGSWASPVKCLIHHIHHYWL